MNTKVTTMRSGWSWIGWGMVLGLTGLELGAWGAEPDPEEVRRRMEIYMREEKPAPVSKPAPKPRPKPAPAPKPMPKPRPKPEPAVKPVPKGVKADKNVGYELYFDGKLVSGSDAADYTRQQAQENCAWNMRDKPQFHIRCVYNGAVLGDREAVKADQNVGYELYFDGKLVSGSDAAHYTRQQARENCNWNMQTKPHLHIRCIYNGEVLGDRPAM